MNEQNMRSLVIYGESDSNIIGCLQNLPNWSLLNGDVSEGHPYFLKNGDMKVYLRVVADNIVETSNVLPQDHSENHPSFSNDIPQSLSKVLYDRNINHCIQISDTDKEILNQASI